jgi:hypothetical protein
MEPDFATLFAPKSAAVAPQAAEPDFAALFAPKPMDWRDAEAKANLGAMQPQDPGDTEVRGNILPFSRNVETNKLSLAVPGMIQDPATLPGDVYTGKVDPQSDEGGRRALGFAMATLPSNVARGPRMRPGAPESVGAKLTVPTAQEAEASLLKSGGRQMNVSKQIEGAVDHADLRAAMTNLNSEMKLAALHPNSKLHPAANDLYGRMLDMVRAPKGDPLAKPGFTNMPAPPMKQASMEELHELRQIADDVIGKGWNPATRSATSEGKLGAMMKDTIDEMIAKHPGSDMLMAGKNEYARGMKSKSITNLLDKASKTTQWDRGDHAGAIRNQVNSFLKSKDSRFLSKDDIKELRKIKKYGFTEALGGQGSAAPMALVIGRVLESMFGIPPGGLFIAGKLARDSINSSKPAQLERMAQRIREGK